MTLEKLTIKAEKKDPGKFKTKIEVLFNPSEITMEFKAGEIENSGKETSEELTTLSMNLFFDTTLQKYPPENVQNYTKKIVNLTQPSIGKNKKRPPLCRLIWGTNSILLADCFLTKVTQQLTHFLEDGKPVRATLECKFQEWKEPEKQKKIENPIDDPVRIVKRGETLSSIATEEFGDPSLWRIIAEENRLINPRKLAPGTVLTIPPLKIPNITKGG